MKILVGDEFGVVKCVNTEKKTVENKFGEVIKDNGTLSIKMLYSNNNDIVSIHNQNSLNVISWASKENFFSIDLKGKGFVSQEVIHTDLLSTIILGDDKGNLKMISFDDEIKLRTEENFTDQIPNNLQRLKHYQSGELFSVFKNAPFSIYDINANKVSFKAKNLPHDELDLKVSMWDTDIVNLSNNPNAIYTSTAYGEIRFYDKKVKPRPIQNKKVCDKVINCLVSTSCNNYVIIGDAVGRIQQLDIRKNFNCCKSFKGSTGAIKDVKVLNKDFIASCGFDRCLNVFNSKHADVESHFYLKTKLTCLAAMEVPEPEESEDDEEEEFEDEEGGELSDDLDEGDEEDF